MPEAEEGLRADLKAMHDRTPGAPDYVLCEHEMQGHYMRGLISHAMSVINYSCDVYQMFTDPSVYGYMWRVHPTLRFDDIYAVLPEKVNPRLARLPWARNNRALRGRTIGARNGLRKDFSDYWEWVAGPIHERFRDYVDPEWFAATGIFSPSAVDGVRRMIERGPAGIQMFGFYPYEIWLWLICVRRLSEWLSELGHPVQPTVGEARQRTAEAAMEWDQVSALGKAMRRSPLLVGGVRRARRFFLKRAARIKYPPRRVDASAWNA
jgi:asparagine synthase (glutamine-hydrolysing)